MLSNQKPSVGKLLISEPFMLDPNFKRSVVFLTEHNKTGSMGFVLNQKSGFLLSDVLEDFDEVEYQIYTGGPVEPDTLHFVHALGDQISGGQEISPGVFWGGNFEALKVLFASKLVPEDKIKFFIGYSGWAPEQLMEEMESNAWFVADAKPEFIFADGEKALWKETVSSLGQKYSLMVNFPENPSLN